MGNRWLLAGVVLGIVLAAGGLPYFSPAAHTLADTALTLVTNGGHHLVHGVAKRGAPRRVVLGFAGIVGVLAPGVTALALVLAAIGTVKLRAVIAVLLVALGIATYAYHPDGVATEAVALAIGVAFVALAASGPLLVAPLGALAGLIAGSYLPGLVLHARVRRYAVSDVHQAFYGTLGDPFGLRVVLVVVAVVPFVVALRFVLRR